MARLAGMIGLAVALTLGCASAAVASPGYATGNVNLRAGPGVDYPVVDVVPAGAPVNIHGCLSGYSWCDVTAAGSRGWMSSNYLQASYHSRRVAVLVAAPPIIAFDLYPYWQRYYPHRSWYHDWRRWDHRHHYRDDHRPRQPAADRQRSRDNHAVRHDRVRSNHAAPSRPHKWVNHQQPRHSASHNSRPRQNVQHNARPRHHVVQQKRNHAKQPGQRQRQCQRNNTCR